MDGKFILLVEDDPEAEAVTRRVLRKNCIVNEVVVLRDGAEALAFLFGTGRHAGRDTGVTPSIILLDLKLPKIGGLKVLKQLRGDPRTQHIPVIVLTSSKVGTDMVDSYQLGAAIFVKKPLDFAQFTLAVRQAGLFWQLHSERPPAPHNGDPDEPRAASSHEPA